MEAIGYHLRIWEYSSHYAAQGRTQVNAYHAYLRAPFHLAQACGKKGCILTLNDTVDAMMLQVYQSDGILTTAVNAMLINAQLARQRVGELLLEHSLVATVQLTLHRALTDMEASSNTLVTHTVSKGRDDGVIERLVTPCPLGKPDHGSKAPVAIDAAGVAVRTN